jgi:hypothetical protein
MVTFGSGAEPPSSLNECRLGHRGDLKALPRPGGTRLQDCNQPLRMLMIDAEHPNGCFDRRASIRCLECAKELRWRRTHEIDIPTWRGAFIACQRSLRVVPVLCPVVMRRARWISRQCCQLPMRRRTGFVRDPTARHQRFIKNPAVLERGAESWGSLHERRFRAYQNGAAQWLRSCHSIMQTLGSQCVV